LESSGSHCRFQVDQPLKSIEHIYLLILVLFGSLSPHLRTSYIPQRRYKLGSKLQNNKLHFESKVSSAGLRAPTRMQSGIFSPFEPLGFHLFVLYSFHENAHIVAEKT
jgi:hypothetical protein